MRRAAARDAVVAVAGERSLVELVVLRQARRKRLYGRGETVVDLGSGAGVGNGMGSALAEVSATMPSVAPTNSPRPMPAMVPLPASPPVGSRPVWREDDQSGKKGRNGR